MPIHAHFGWVLGIFSNKVGHTDPIVDADVKTFSKFFFYFFHKNTLLMIFILLTFLFLRQLKHVT